ncbi:hypothetical protein BCR41DRAFT_65426 [Lobosporangium transversale]|uniref:Uncharacterized protein n=1 Tax=Lobosporangium transversale TaxID=64571 RepID=A0A1Y2GMG0_9FUNG|nr:hypothetical protein BCR41DRAFT_65426 [Lobosporangium transversale]ORZ15529.1 hypothetical protein BCR41DRAFT_65426 [Lobosporangium transversale]|eukprot:XP_021881277.1 hypothetical protein BCR41DRAFT_65426 [Lobosporangium transversale]
MRSVSSAPQEKLPPLHPADSVEPCVNDPLSWAQKKAKRGEDIEMSKFAEELGFHCEEDAHPLFMQVLQSTTVPYIIRRRSLNQYKVWKASKGGEFWADRRIRYQVRMSTKSAVSEIIEGSGAVREHYISVNNSTLIPLLSNNFEVGPKRGSGLSSPTLSPPCRPLFNINNDEGAVTGTFDNHEQLSSGDKGDEGEVFGRP